MFTACTAFILGEIAAAVFDVNGWFLFGAILFISVLTLACMAIRSVKDEGNKIKSKEKAFKGRKLLGFAALFFPLFFLGFLVMASEEATRDIVWNIEDECCVYGVVKSIKSTDYGFNITLGSVSIIVGDLEGEVYDSDDKSDKEYDLITCRKILVQSDEMPDISIGNEVTATGTLEQFSEAANYGNFDSRRYYMSTGIYACVESTDLTVSDDSYNFIMEKLRIFREYLITRLEYTQEGASGIFSVIKGRTSVFAAIILGDKSDVDEEITDLYSDAGIAHILAISGLHISFIGMFIYTMLRKRFGFAVSAAFSTVLVVAFGIMSGLGIASVRAIIMFGLKLLGEVLGEHYDSLTAMSLAGIILMLSNPFIIYNSGFQMSFAAIIGILVIMPEIKKIVEARSEFLKSVILTLTINAVMNPIIAYNYFRLPTYSFLLNIVVVPLMSVVLVSGIAGIFFSCFSVVLGRMALIPGSFVLLMYDKLCVICKKLPFGSVIVGRPKTWILVLYYVLLLVFVAVFGYIVKLRKRAASEEKKKIPQEGRTVKESKNIDISMRRFFVVMRITTAGIFAALSLIIYFYPVNLLYGGDITFGFLDVGQGDGIIARFSDGTVMTVDCGSSSVENVGEKRVIPCLESLRIKEIDYAVMTHADDDHTSGLKEIIESSDEGGITVKNLVLPDIILKDDAYMEMVELAEENGVNVLYITAGDTFSFGNTIVTCIHPDGGDYGDERNDYSTVLSIENGSFSALLCGDISSEVEEKIIDRLKKNYTLLKVAHHGSKYSSSEEFLDNVSPDISVISVGLNNLYGHPTEEVLSRLASCGSLIYRTDLLHGVFISIEDGVCYNITS